MKHLLIIGARGCGRETYNFFLECKPSLGDIECVGFLDDKTDALDGFAGYPKVVSSVEEYTPKPGDVFICGLGEPKWVRHYTKIIEEKGGEFISLISRNASIGKNTKIGKGCIIPGWTVISSDITIGNHVNIGVFCDVGHDVKIGDYCHIGAYAFFGGFSKVGECVTVHPRANILPHKRVGDNSIIGASSVVIRNVKSNTTVFGVPAREVK